MISFLFWNLGKRALRNRVARLVSRFEIDVLLLAECGFNSGELETAIDGLECAPFREFEDGVGKVRVYHRLARSSMTSRYRSLTGNVSTYRFKIKGRPNLLIFLVHLPSKRDWDRDDQTLFANEVARDVERIEDRDTHQRTILVGDLNMNPFDPGVVGAQALHSVMSKEVAPTFRTSRPHYV